jgi:hypothetical protein
MFRVEWWHGRKQLVRTAQTADNVRELLDVIPPKSHLRILDELSSILCDPHIFKREEQVA